MGKGDRRGKVKPKGIPDLAPIKPRRRQPRENGRFVKPQEDAPRVALTARCHHYTTKAATNEERDKAKAQGVPLTELFDTLQTFDPRIYAIGECVSHRGSTYGLVAPLFEMAKV